MGIFFALKALPKYTFIPEALYKDSVQSENLIFERRKTISEAFR